VGSERQARAFDDHATTVVPPHHIHSNPHKHRDVESGAPSPRRAFPRYPSACTVTTCRPL
jgi:hypothetical protein